MFNTEDAISSEMSNSVLSKNSNIKSTEEHRRDGRIKDNFRWRVSLQSFQDISDIDFILERKCISCLDMNKLNEDPCSLHQSLVSPPWKSSSSVSSVDTKSAELIYESISSLGSLNSLCRSWCTWSIDLCSRGNYSSLLAYMW